jgi:putative heme-binding domain-containing protein
MVAILGSGSASAGLKRGILQAAARFEDKRIPQVVLEGYETLFAGDRALREDALRVLAGRQEWAVLLARAVMEVNVPVKHFTIDIVRQLALHEDAAVQGVIEKNWRGLLASGPSEVKEAEVARIRAVLAGGLGDAEKGKLQFTARCGLCHKLFGEGGGIGPELTGYDRGNAGFWLENLFYPSQEIREGFGAYIVRTKGGQVLTGLMDAQEAGGVVIKDMASNRTAVKAGEIEKMEASPVSLMPEGLTAGMGEGDLKDFFAYLMSGL